MPISSSKCSQFDVKEKFSKAGKPQGFAVVGKAKLHDKWEVVRVMGEEQIYTTKAEAQRAAAELSRTADTVSA